MESASKKPELLAIVGPTASGKSELALKIAKNLTARLLLLIHGQFIKAWILVRPSQQKRAKAYSALGAGFG
jgi:uridine kinase